jgi:hypothetical protein
MGTLSVAVHGTGQIVKLTCGFTTPDTGSVIRAYRTTSSGAKTRLRLTRGGIVGDATYGGLVINTDLPVVGFTPVGSTYSNVVILDPEPPQGVTCTYSFVVVNSSGATVDSASAVTPSAPSMGGDFLYDLSGYGRGVVTNVLEFNRLTTSIKSDVNLLLNGAGPTVSVNIANLPSFSLRLGTFSDAEAAAIRGLFRLGGPIYALSPRTLTYGFEGPVYFAVTDYTESRATNLGAEVTRIFEINCQQVYPPGSYYRTLAYAATISAAWSSFYSSYAAETFSVIDGIAGHPVSYPVGVVV